MKMKSCAHLINSNGTIKTNFTWAPHGDILVTCLQFDLDCERVVGEGFAVCADH